MAVKTFDHAVIWNGKLIPANTPIAVREEKTVTANDNGKRGKKPQPADRPE